MTAINDLSVGGENLYNFSLSVTILKNVGFFMHLRNKITKNYA